MVGDPTPLGDAWDLAIGAGSVWVTQFDGRLVRIDERTGRVQARLRPSSGFFGIAIAFGGGSIWTSQYPSLDPNANRRATFVKIDPSTNRVDEVIDARALDARTQTIEFGDGAVWVIDHDHNIVKLDPMSSDVLARQPLSFLPIGIIASDGSVLLADPQGNRIVAVDPRSAEVVRSSTLGIAPFFPVLVGGSVWSLDQGAWGSPVEDSVYRIDPETLTTSQTVDVGGSPAGLAGDGTSVWIALRSGEVVRLGP